MKEIRLLHIADAHLDTPFYGRDETLRRKLREACREAFRRAVSEAIERNANAVAIAGDLFDNDILSFATERFLFEQMTRLKEVGISVFYATGNHDPGRANYRARQIVWPDNVHVFSGTEPQTIEIFEPDGSQVGWLTGAGHSTPHEETNLASRFPQANDDLPHVALMHAQIVSARSASTHSRYASCTKEDLAFRLFDYWALGHVHVAQRVFDDLPVWYSGNIQGRNPRETGQKGALWVTVQKGQPIEPEFVALSPIVWDSIEMECPRDARTLVALAQGLVISLREKIGDANVEHFVRVILTGESVLARDLHDADNQLELAEMLQDAVGASWLEVRPYTLVAPVDIDSYRGSKTVLGTTLEVIETCRKNDDLLKSLCPDDLALAERRNDIEYLRDLLTRSDLEVASRLVPEVHR